ncbi:MAG: macro domain-containing protein [Thermoguttaceae bacterium]|nr:macro domain-containing protein [Thermoguttaceae bacterium]
MIKYCEGNILLANAEALVNTVNTVGVMGKGIALQFKKAFPDMEKEYIAACKNGSLRIGKLQVWDSGSFFNPRYIINFPTKQHWRYPSKLSYIQAGLTDLIQIIRQLGITSIAIPPLGCGLGGLDWLQVNQEIVSALGAMEDVEIQIYKPNGAPTPENIVNKTKEPQLTNNLANFLRIVDNYYSLEYFNPTLIEIQKLSYFYECAGENLNLQFDKYIYGPYSKRLHHWLNNLEGHYILGLGDGTNVNAFSEIQLLPDCMKKVNEFLSQNKDDLGLSKQRADKVIHVIQGFENPFGMELLASVHWVASKENADTLEKCISLIQNWSPRKRELMKPGYIEIAWNRLKSENWI